MPSKINKSFIFHPRARRLTLFSKDKIVFDSVYDLPGSVDYDDCKSFEFYAGKFEWDRGTICEVVGATSAALDFNKEWEITACYVVYGSPSIAAEMATRPDAIGSIHLVKK